MPSFNYEAMTTEGRLTKGKITADYEKEARRQLKSQGLSVLTLDLEVKGQEGLALFTRKLKTEDHLLLLNELAILLEAGVPLAETVDSIATSGFHPDISKAFDKIGSELKRGKKFSNALQEHMPALPFFVFQLIGVGETTGNLVGCLKDAAEQMAYDLEVKKEIQGALTYPAILIIGGMAAVMFIFIAVVPKFESIFAGKLDQLDTLPRIVMGSGIFFRDNMVSIGIFLLILIVVGIFIFKQKSTKDSLLEFSQSLPLVGTWLKESETSRWAKILSILLRNKIPLMEALALSKDGLKIPSVRDQMVQVASAVKGGSALASALKDHTQFTAISINLVKVGERAGNLPVMLSSLSTLYGRSGKERMQKFLTLIEPLAIIIVGGIIGLIVGGIVTGIQSVTDLALK